MFLHSVASFSPNPLLEDKFFSLQTRLHPAPRFLQLEGALFKKEAEENTNGVLLDVRTAFERYFGMLPGAISLSCMSSNFKKKVLALDRSKTYYVYCRGGGLSLLAGKIMHELGLDVRQLKGGLWKYPH